MRTLLAILLPLSLLACQDSGLTVHDRNDPPEVTFTAPGDDEVFIVGEVVGFVAHVQDDHTALDQLELTWRTTDGGALTGEAVFDGDEAMLTVVDLAVGAQTITLTAVDEQGESSEDEVSIVVEDNLPPGVDISSPTADSVWAHGLSIPVLALFSDDRDGAGQIALEWSDAATGQPNAPEHPDAEGEASFSLDGLAIDAWTLTVRALDSDGADRTVSVVFEVVDGDVDGDGHLDEALGGDDCDDSDDSVYAGATELCDGLDNDCNTLTDDNSPFVTWWYTDDDHDGYGVTSTGVEACDPAPGQVDTPGDCDDSNNAIHPDATEVCNEIDDDCVGGADDGLPTEVWYFDNDDDDFGTGSTTVMGCAPPPGFVDTGGDCDDFNDAVNPGATEACNDIDDNCAGGVDEGLTTQAWYFDNDHDGYGDNALSVVDCGPPLNYVGPGDDCDDANLAVNPGATEVCNGIDDDCANGIDDGFTLTWYWLDFDQDGYGAAGTDVEACAAPPWHVDVPGDCDDNEPLVNPGEAENCGDGIDNDCVGGPDDGCVVDWSGVWDTEDIFYQCGDQFGLGMFWYVTMDWGSLTIMDANPDIEVTSPGPQPGHMVGTFSTAFDFEATSFIGGDCHEYYTLTGTFTGPDTFDAVLTAEYVSFSSPGICLDCPAIITWDLHGTR